MTGPTAGEHRYVTVVFVDAALAHIDRAFTYAVPEGVSVGVGSVVRAPVRGKRRTAVVVETLAEPDVARVVPFSTVMGPGIPADIVDLARWVSDRYLSTLGEAVAAALPARVAAEEKSERAPVPVTGSPAPGQLFRRYKGGATLARADRGAFVWRPAADENRGEVIAALIGGALARGRGALVLLPEINIDGEVASAIETRFGDAVAWLGSDRSPRLRYRDWLALRAGSKRIAVGGRGAVFAPVPDLGLVVVDDESHQSYKEGRAPRFHARAVAAERARRSGGMLVLVGVPPSIEARAAAASSGYTPVVPDRAGEVATRPPVTVVDRSKTDDGLTPTARTLAQGREAIKAGGRFLVLAHRGGAHADAVAERTFRIAGARRPVRLDARSDPSALARAMQDADCIVATPVIAKDLILREIAVLAIIDADAALAQAEFRAPEETFAAWWHAARWAAGGSIVIETAQPAHPAIAALTRWDPDVLWRAEAARRRELGYPPFAAIARIDVPADRADAVADELAGASDALEILGPVERSGRWVLVVRAARRDVLLDALRPVAARWRETDEPMRIDVDPREVLVPKWRS